MGADSPLPLCTKRHTLPAALCRMVIGVLGPLSDDRRCYRMAGEMLLEQTVKDVKPAVAEHKAGVRGAPMKRCFHRLTW